MPYTIESLQDMDLFIDKIKDIDHFQAALAKRPNTEWDIIDINISVHLAHNSVPSGCPKTIISGKARIN